MIYKSLYFTALAIIILIGSVQYKYIYTQALEFEQYLPNFSNDNYIYPKNSLFANFQLPSKKLIYLAPYHTSNTKGKVAKMIESVILNEKPDLVILEGFGPSNGINPSWIINLANERIASGYCGESLYAAYICDQCKINFIGGEIDDAEVFKYLLKKGYKSDDAVFYMLVQQIPFWHKDNLFEKNNIKKQFEEFMNCQIADWFKVSINYSFEDFLKYHKLVTGSIYNPEKDLLWTNGQDSKPWAYKGQGATIYQRIAADIMNIRDNHIIKMIKNSISKYNKVIAIFGASRTGSHYIWEKKALVSFLGQPQSETEF